MLWKKVKWCSTVHGLVCIVAGYWAGVTHTLSSKSEADQVPSCEADAVRAVIKQQKRTVLKKASEKECLKVALSTSFIKGKLEDAKNSSQSKDALHLWLESSCSCQEETSSVICGQSQHKTFWCLRQLVKCCAFYPGSSHALDWKKEGGWSKKGRGGRWERRGVN